MAAFQFRDHALHLDIAGNLFDISVNPKTIQSIVEWGRQAQEKANQYRSRTDPESVLELETFMVSILDRLLGEGASARIFAGREQNLFDLVDIMNYIVSEVRGYQEQIAAPPLSDYHPNRAQRHESKQNRFGVDVLREALNKLEAESCHE